MILTDGFASVGGVPLACPVDKRRLEVASGELTCPSGHRYPLVGDVAVLLRNDVADSHPYFDETREAARASDAKPDPEVRTGGVDPFVQQEIVKTNGILYRNALGALARYPIPE